MATILKNQRIAVLIDADNAQASIFSALISEVSRYGTATIKRAYGDWTTPNLAPWKTVLHANAIQPIQQFGYTIGKNATDSALIIDAMDILHAGVVDGFCLVSSDSDFTRLATRIREAGHVVYGIGAKHTPEPFVAACDKFIYTEILKQQPAEEKIDPSLIKQKSDFIAPSSKELSKFKIMVINALEVVAREDGWASLSSLGSQLSRNHPSFDSRNYGVSKLGELIRKQKYLESKDVASGEDGQNINIYVRYKKEK